jgi:hypothetical protein
MATVPVSNAGAATSSLTVNVYDGTRRPFTAPVDVLYRVFSAQNPSQALAQPMGKFASQPFTLPFHDNLFDNHRVVVTANGWQQAGYVPVRLSNKSPVILDLMMIPKNPSFDFTDAPWDRIKTALPFLGSDVTDNVAKDRYNQLKAARPKSLACVLNITSAMAQIRFPDGTGPLDYIKEMKWDSSLAQDRFFAYCDAKLIDIVRDAAAHNMFAEEKGSNVFHPGSTASWKQVLFDEANVQLTFHESDTKMIGGVKCVVIEPDIDYYKDIVSHSILEVIPNTFTGGLTQPALVYVLRWIVGRRAGGDFRPPYTIVPA